MNTPVGNVLPKFDIAPPPTEIELPDAGGILTDSAEETPSTARGPAVSAAPSAPAEAEPPATAPPPCEPAQELRGGAKAESALTDTPAAATAEGGSPPVAGAPAEASTSGRQAFSEDETIKLLMDLASLQEDLERAREQTNSARRHVEIVQEQLAKTTVEKATLQEQLQRLMAEFDNYRKRVEREKAEAIERGKQTVILNLLETLDNLDRALATGRAEGGSLTDFLAGVELIQRQLADGLSSIGVKPIPAVGEAFDPMVHEAIATDETDEYKPNTVLAELKRGYKLGDRLLRPSMVRVAVRPAST
ncbi:MAG: nucleotide exchange factor GrpE [Chloracidobacterium sp. CP2_5A]|nr:MAG: nucleotide exchange factor GrpE [Chloracidobacterium sp. CP2_5A]